MLEPATLLAWSALALIVTLSPGPDTLLVAAHGARFGWRAGVAAAAGVALGSLYYASLFGFGVMSILVAVPAIYVAVKIVGAAYLAWLGFGLLRRALAKSEPPPPRPGVLRGRPFAQGLLTNALNPKVALFYLAALPQFAGDGAAAPQVGALLILLHGLFGLVWLSFIAFAAARARAFAWSRNVARWIEGAVGAAFMSFAGRLALLAQR